MPSELDRRALENTHLDARASYACLQWGSVNSYRVGAIMRKHELWTVAICLGVIVGTGVMVYRFLQPML
jgi:hypothetical protein